MESVGLMFVKSCAEAEKKENKSKKEEDLGQSRSLKAKQMYGIE